jgi:ABC-type uncharacterized transport system auxiliary subunit
MASNSRMLVSLASLAALLVLLAVLSGCGSVPETQYYTIGRIVPEAPLAAGQVKMTVGVPRFEADGIYERDNLLFRRGDYEIAVDYYRRWGVPPQTMLADATIDYLRAASLFSSVLRLPSMADYDALLSGRIIRFEEAGGQMQLTLEFSLQRRGGKAILWRQEVSSTAAVAVIASPEARIVATEKCLADCLARMTGSLSSANINLQ